MLQLSCFLWCILTFFALLSPADAQDPADYPNRVPGQCAGGGNQFDCDLTGAECISFALVRNCANDCSNGADEECGTGQTLCDTSLPGTGCGKCVSTPNAASQCFDRRWESLCAEAETIECTSTVNCVFPEWVGDGENDCGDWSDENTCVVGTNTCDPNADCAFTPGDTIDCCSNIECTCNDGYTGNGISCDLITSTSTSTSTSQTSTSTSAPTTPRPATDILEAIPGNCSNSDPLEFDCGNNLCIPYTGHWNCIQECPDGLDEACWTGQLRCPAPSCRCYDPSDTRMTCDADQTDCGSVDQFQCVIGGCVPDIKVLDGTADCVDNSDEDYCEKYQNCPPGETCSYNALTHSFGCSCPEQTQPNDRGYCLPDQTLPRDCDDVLQENPKSESGVETIYADGNCVSIATCSKEAMCDQKTEDGGWTAIQLRTKDSDTSFDRNWTDYKNGFGDPETPGDFWIGNDFLNQMTSDGSKTYEVMLKLTPKTGPEFQVRYDSFAVGDETSGYPLSLGTLTEGTVDGLASARNQQFSTADQGPQNTCAASHKGGWWLESGCTANGDLNADPSILRWNGEAIDAVQVYVRDVKFQAPATDTPVKQTGSNVNAGACILMALLPLVYFAKK